MSTYTGRVHFMRSIAEDADYLQSNLPYEQFSKEIDGFLPRWTHELVGSVIDGSDTYQLTVDFTGTFDRIDPTTALRNLRDAIQRAHDGGLAGSFQITELRKDGVVVPFDKATAVAEPLTLENGDTVWTGRYDSASGKRSHREVMTFGKDFLVINTSEGVHVYPYGETPDVDEDWIDKVVVRAMNSEDAYRNWWGAMSQWHVWFNKVNSNWEELPFTDEAGNFPVTGGDHGGDGYDAMPPDDTAWDGITRPDLFTERGGFVPVSVELDRTEAPALTM